VKRKAFNYSVEYMDTPTRSFEKISQLYNIEKMPTGKGSYGSVSVGSFRK